MGKKEREGGEKEEGRKKRKRIVWEVRETSQLGATTRVGSRASNLWSSLNFTVQNPLQVSSIRPFKATKNKVLWKSSTIYGLSRQRVMYPMNIKHARSRDKVWRLLVCFWNKEQVQAQGASIRVVPIWSSHSCRLATLSFAMHLARHWNHGYCIEQTPRGLLSGPLQLRCVKRACPNEMHVSRLRLILSVFVASLVFLDVRRGSFFLVFSVVPRRSDNGFVPCEPG
jgi:hypothetical protein